MPELSPNMQVVKAYVESKYGDDIYHVGVYNCRRIAGSQTYSQHSWPNAIDIHVTDGTWRATDEEKAVGDAIHDDLHATFGDDLYEHLWWTTNHWNHLHVSTYPKGWLTPPCAGGSLRIKYANGVVENVSEFPLTIEGGDDLAILTEEDQSALKAWLDRIEDLESTIAYITYLIPDIRKNIITKDELDAAIAAIDQNTAVDQHARSLAQQALNKLAAIKAAI